MLDFGLGHLLGLVFLGPISPSGFRLIVILTRPTLALGPIFHGLGLGLYWYLGRIGLLSLGLSLGPS